MVTRKKVDRQVPPQVPPWSRIKPEILHLMDMARLMNVLVTRRMIKEAIRVIRKKPFAVEESKVRRSMAMKRAMNLL
jgi:hypothetical protein